jgi:hypothetical protein
MGLEPEFWWWLDRSDGTATVRARAHAANINPLNLTNAQIEQRIQVEQFARRCWQTYWANLQAEKLYADVEAPPWWDYGPTDVTRACPSTPATPRKRSRTTSRS